MTDILFNQRVGEPPDPEGDFHRGNWETDVTNSLNADIPPTSVFSFSTPNSNVTAQEGTIGVNLNPSDIGLWFKESGNSNIGWRSLTLSVYGGISLDDNTTAQTNVASPTTIDFDIANSAENMPFSDMTSDAASSLMTVLVAGDYSIEAHTAFRAAAGNSIWHTHLYVNGSETSIGGHRKIGTANDVGSMSFGGIMTLAVNDVLGSWISRSDSGTGADVTFEHVSLYAERL